MNTGTHFFNGKLVSEEHIMISPRDLGFTRGYAVFDFLRTYSHHRPFKFREHIDRLFNSARLIGLEIPWDKEQVKKWVLETLAANETAEEKAIKIIISGGISHTMLPGSDPTIMILVDPAMGYPKEYYEKGVGVMSVRHARYNPAAKTNNYIEGVQQTVRAQKMGASEPLYYSDKQVFECSNSNIFAVIGKRLLTPASNILEGVTRGVLLEILKLDIPIEARDFTFDELLTASEAFLTASGKEVMPITSIDGKPLGSGTVGPITEEVMRQYQAYTASDLW